MSAVKNVLLKVLGPLFLAESKVVSNEKLSPHFQFLTIKGKKFKKADWIPGQKIQVRLGDELMRSYTPSSWDKENGVVQTLVYMHGKGPGALWARDAKPGAKATILGPRGSLVLDESLKEVFFFGDETTFGLAYAIRENFKHLSVKCFFESTDTEESKAVLEKFNLKDSALYPLSQADIIASDIARGFDMKETSKIVLSGKQQTIVAIRQKLYTLGITPEQIIVKVYWGWKDDPNGKLKK